MPKSVIVTLANSSHFSQAQQLFGSIFRSSRRKGDCVVLTDSLTDKQTKWFEERGIIVKCFPVLFRKKIGIYPPILALKLYIFSKYFKKWQTVIYLDADVIVRGSLESLENLQGFWARDDLDGHDLEFQLKRNSSSVISSSNYQQIVKEIRSRYDLKKTSFNAGVLIFSTDIIKPSLFKELLALLRKYADAFHYGDQPVLNLFFYKQWKSLPLEYNVTPNFIHSKYHIPYSLISGRVLHFASYGNYPKPWEKQNFFFSRMEKKFKLFKN